MSYCIELRIEHTRSRLGFQENVHISWGVISEILLIYVCSLRRWFIFSIQLIISTKISASVMVKEHFFSFYDQKPDKFSQFSLVSIWGWIRLGLVPSLVKWRNSQELFRRDTMIFPLYKKNWWCDAESCNIDCWL